MLSTLSLSSSRCQAAGLLSLNCSNQHHAVAATHLSPVPFGYGNGAGAMSVYSLTKEQQDAAADEFGAMLRRWRLMNGWTQYTAVNWAKEAGLTAICHSGLSELERGLTKNPRVGLFLSLASLNALVHAQDWSGVRSRKLLDQLKTSRAITDQDGNPWGPEQFWSCRAGLLAPPDWLAPPKHNPAPLLSAEQAEELCTSWATAARRIARQTGAGRRGLDQLRQMAPVASRRDWADVLDEQLIWTPEQLALGWDPAASEWQPALWLAQWEAELKSEVRPSAA